MMNGAGRSDGGERLTFFRFPSRSPARPIHFAHDHDIDAAFGGPVATTTQEVAS